MHLRVNLKFLGAILVHPVRRQNFAGTGAPQILQHLRLCRNKIYVLSFSCQQFCFNRSPHMSSERQKSWPGGNLLSKIEQQSKLHFHTSHQQSGVESKAPEICFGPFGKSASAQISAPIGFHEEDRRFLPDDDERLKMMLVVMTIMMLEMVAT